MKIDRSIVHAASLILLIPLLGWLVFLMMNNHPDGISPDGFRLFIWHFRSLDLMIQVVLVFAGSLGIAALLPLEEPHD